MAISDDRKEQLLEQYSQLKKVLAEIDNKYSVSYVEVELDFPPSLGLQHLEFLPKTQAELFDMADKKVSHKYEEKKRNLEKSYQNTMSNLNYQIEKTRLKYSQQFADLQKKQAEKQREGSLKMSGNGMMFSTAFETFNDDWQTDAEKELQDLQSQADEEIALLTAKAQSVTAAYEASLQSLNEQKIIERTVTVLELQEKQTKRVESVQKYNQSVDEKETKYQASCMRALQNAVTAEFQRGLEATKLLWEIGESGVHQQIISEKLVRCRATFRLFNREEAHYVLGLDALIEANLESAYDSFLEWVNTVLPE